MPVIATILTIILAVIPNIFLLDNPTVFHYPKLMVIYLMALLGLPLLIKKAADSVVRLSFLDVLIILFWLIYLLKSLISVSIYSSFFGDIYGPNNEGLLLISSLLILFYSFKLYFSDRYLKLISYLVVLGVVYGLLWGWINGSAEGFYRQIALRMSAVEYSPIYFANYLLIGLPVSLVLFLKAQKQSGKILALAGLLSITAGLVLSLTRSAWIVAGIVIPLAIVYWVRSHKINLKSFSPQTIYYGTAVLILSGVFCYFLLPVFQQRVVSTFTDQSKTSSISLRLQEYQSALNILKDYPLGIGADTVRYVFPRYRSVELNLNPQEWRSTTSNIRNYYLQLAVTVGLPGLGVFLSLVAYFIYLFIGFVRKSKGDLLIFGLFCAWLSIVLHFALYNSSIISLMFFWVLMGILYSQISKKIKTKIIWSLTLPECFHRGMLALTLFLSVVGIVGLLINLYSQIHFLASFHQKSPVQAIQAIDYPLQINPYNLNFWARKTGLELFVAERVVMSGQYQDNPNPQIFKEIEQGLGVFQQLDPNDPIGAYYAALTSYLQFRSERGANREQMFNKAEADVLNFVRSDPTNPEAMDLLTLVYLELDGQHLVEAEKTARQTLSLKPDYITGLHHLGEVLKQQGKFDQAINAYNQALEIDSTDRVAKAELEKLYILSDQKN